jgi:hypothetical protein
MNENNNRVQAALPDATFSKVINLLTEVSTTLESYFVGLTPEERMGLPKINVDNRDFIGDAINQMYLPEAKNVLPPFVKPENAESDLLMFAQMEKISVQLLSLFGKADATRIIAGSEAYGTALMFKRLADAGEAAGIPGADKLAVALRARFKANGGNTKPDAATDSDAANPAQQ